MNIRFSCIASDYKTFNRTLFLRLNSNNEEMDEPVKRATISAGRHPSGLYGRVDPYKSHLSIESKSNEANTDRYLKKIKPRVHTSLEKASKIDLQHHNKSK